MRFSYLPAIAGIATFAAPAAASTIDLAITIPRLSVAEYHRPYVAVWLEKPGDRAIRTLAVWYDHDMRGGEGRKWLSDLRTWWRKGGRSASIDGVTGATKAPGPQRLSVPASTLRGLAPGEYRLVIEAAREVGGRDIVQIPVTLGASRPATVSGRGKSELGAISATIKP